MICEECEEAFRSVHCPACEQHLCQSCDQKLHKKGTRALHKRTPVAATERFKLLFNYVLVEGNIGEEVHVLKAALLDSHLLAWPQYTVFQCLGTKGEALASLEQELGLHFAPCSLGNLQALDHHLVDTYSPAAFLDVLMVYATSSLQEDTVIHIKEVYPFVRLTQEAVQRTVEAEGGSPRKRVQFAFEALDRAPSDIVLEQCHEAHPSLLSQFIRSEDMKELQETGTSLNEYLETCLGLRELRTTPPTLKPLLSGSPHRPDPQLSHVLNDLTFDSQLPLETSLLIQRTLMQHAASGTVLLDYPVLLKQLTLMLAKPEAEVCSIILHAADLGIIIINSRQITQKHSLDLVSLRAEVLSLEGLFWIIQSLKLDRLTPVEDIVLSRIKEAFGLKLKRKVWAKQLAVFANHLQRQEASKGGPPYSRLAIQFKENPTLRHSNTFVFDVQGLDVAPDDTREIGEEEPDWKALRHYLHELFSDDLLLYNQTSSNPDEGRKESSLETPFYRDSAHSKLMQSYSKQDEDSETKCLQSHTSLSEKASSEVFTFKGMSGGRYGLAQFLKYFGPEQFQRLSLGRLSRLVQKSIETNILKYHKTFLMRSVEAESEEQAKHDEIDMNDRRVQIIREKIIEALIEHDNYIPLAQLIQILSKKLEFKFDLKELGFSRLTNFVEKLCKVG